MLVENYTFKTINLNSFPQILQDNQFLKYQFQQFIKTDCLFLLNISYHNYIFEKQSFINLIGFRKDDNFKIIFVEFGDKINLIDKFCEMCKIELNENEIIFCHDEFFDEQFFISKNEIQGIDEFDIINEVIK